MRNALPLILLALAAAPAAAKDKAPAGHPSGPATDCINVRQIQDTLRPDDHTIWFRMSGNRWYRNDLPQRCPRLDGIGTAISYRVTTSQLCSIDIVRIVDTVGGMGEFGACGLGKFTPWERETKGR